MMGFLAKRMLYAGAPAITKMDVVPVSAITCVRSMRMAFVWCGMEVVQFEATTVMSLSLLLLLCDNRHT